MPGQVKHIIDQILAQRGKGNPTLIATTKTKLILKGIDPDRFSLTTPDDAATVEKTRAVARELGVVVA